MRRSRERSVTPKGNRELSAERRYENLTFALAARAVEALEDLALNVAAIRQRLERLGPRASGARPEHERRGPNGAYTAGKGRRGEPAPLRGASPSRPAVAAPSRGRGRGFAQRRKRTSSPAVQACISGGRASDGLGGSPR